MKIQRTPQLPRARQRLQAGWRDKRAIKDQNIAIIAAEFMSQRGEGVPELRSMAYSECLDMAIDAADCLSRREMYWREPAEAWDALDWYETTDAIVAEMLRGAGPWESVKLALACRFLKCDYTPKGDRPNV